MYVQPVAGRSVPDPERNDLLPPEGREVEATQYWQRRIADGDVSQAVPKTVAAAKAASKQEG